MPLLLCSSWKRLLSIVFVSLFFFISLTDIISPSLAVADGSPEFHQLLNDIRKEIGHTAASTSDATCRPEVLFETEQALGQIFKEAAFAEMGRVAVKELEIGGKLALGIVGLSEVATAYSIIKCRIENDDWVKFSICTANELAGYGIGKGLDALDVPNIPGNLAGTAYDEWSDRQKEKFGKWWDAYNAAGSAIATYRASEFITAAPSRRLGNHCDVEVSARWSKQDMGPGARGGEIVFLANVRNCDCVSAGRGAAPLKEGSLYFKVSVQYAKAQDDGGDQPGWEIGPIREFKVNALCCDGRQMPRTAITPGGAVHILRDPGETVTPPPPPPPVTPPPPAPEPPAPPAPEPAWSIENPCPECRDAADRLSAAKGELENRQAALKMADDELTSTLSRKGRLAREIAELEARLKSQEGTGGSSYDPSTGTTVDAWTQANGSVKVTVRDKTGNVVEERTRPRRDLAGTKKELDAKQKELDELNAREKEARKRVDETRRAVEDAKKAVDEAMKNLEDCIREKCRRTRGACAGQSSMPVEIGPRSQYGTGLAKTLGDTAKGMALGLLSGGGLSFGGRGKSSGGDDGGKGGPDVVVNPIKDFKTFTDQKTGITLEAGGKTTDNGILTSLRIKDAPGKGTFHAMYLVNDDCRAWVPVRYFVYKLWLEWSLHVSWTRDTYMNNRLVKHEAGESFSFGKQDLASGIIAVTGDPVWKRHGFSGASGGIQDMGAEFKIPVEEIGKKNLKLVVHVTRPELDPVTTTPIEMAVSLGKDGALLFNQ